jgi:hypothetical protein
LWGVRQSVVEPKTSIRKAEWLPVAHSSGAFHGAV